VCASIRAGFESGLNSEPASTGTIQLWCGPATASGATSRRGPVASGKRMSPSLQRSPPAATWPSLSEKTDVADRRAVAGHRETAAVIRKMVTAIRRAVARHRGTVAVVWKTVAVIHPAVAADCKTVLVNRGAHARIRRPGAPRQAARTGGLPFQPVDPIRNRTAPAAAPGPHRRLRLRSGCIRRAGRRGR
jgi:hypothetical protein